MRGKSKSGAPVNVGTNGTLSKCEVARQRSAGTVNDVCRWNDLGSVLIRVHGSSAVKNALESGIDYISASILQSPTASKTTREKGLDVL